MKHKKYHSPTVEIKSYNVMIDGQSAFNQQVRNDLITYDIIRKIVKYQGDNYTTGCSMDYNYFKKHYKMIEIYLSKQQALDADPKAIQQINFTGNLENSAVIIFIIEEVKETVLDCSQGTVFYFLLYINLNINNLNLKLSNSKINKFKSEIKNGTEVTLKMSSNIVADSSDENSFPHKFLLINTQISRLRKDFTNNSSPNIEISKTA